MNELEELRAMFIAIRSQADAGVRALTALIAKVEEEEGPDEKAPPRTFGRGQP